MGKICANRPDRPGLASIRVGPVQIDCPVFLAPMSGITDLPFRRMVTRLGGGPVVSEMIASHELVAQKPDSVRRAAFDDAAAPKIMQLAGRKAHWMEAGARLAAGAGTDIIDINMGCPAKKLTSGLSGSALMRDLDHATRLIEATVRGAGDVPVTLKMRTGWDMQNRNAPALAQRAEAAGVRLVTVHGRTRNQFYEGHADWGFIGRVKAAVAIPVIANGDVGSVADARALLAQSGADGLMIGRAAQGRPWLLAQVRAALSSDGSVPEPTLTEQIAITREHYDALLTHYGRAQGVRIARKHLGWAMERWGLARSVRQTVFRLESAEEVWRLLPDSVAAAARAPDGTGWAAA